MSAALSFINLIFSLLVIAVLSIAVRGWASAIARLWHGEPLLPWQPRRPVPWGLIDIVVLIALLFVLENGLVQANRALFGAPMPAANAAPTIDPEQLMLMNVGYVVFFVVAICYLMLFRRATLRDLGFDLSKLREDLTLGVIAFSMLAPIVYAIQALLVRWWPSKHPLIESIRDNMDPTMLIAGGIAAVLAAPIFEEFAFRVLFQGWLENLILVTSRSIGVHVSSDHRMQYRHQSERVLQWLCSGPGPELEPEEIAASVKPEESQQEGSTPTVDISAPPSSESLIDAAYRSPAHGYWPIRSSREVSPLPTPACYIAIVISSVIFALLHYSHGPDWVPLIVLAMGLGYIYQRTHRILPCIIVHLLINGVSYGILLVEVLGSP